MLAEIAQLEGFLEGLSGLLISFASLLVQTLEADLQLALASLTIQLDRVVKALGAVLLSEALEVVANKNGAGQLGRSRGHHLLGTVFGEDFEESLYSMGCGFALKVVDDAGCREIEKSFRVLLLVFVGGGSAVDGLDVLRVHGNGGSSICNDLVPLAHSTEAGGTVGVEYGVGLAKNRLRIEANGLVVCLVTIGSVAGLFQFGRILFALLGRQLCHAVLVNLGELVFALHGGGLVLGGSWGGFLGLGSLALGFFSLPSLLLAELRR